MPEDKPEVIPVLRILDEAKAKEFYIDWLGFKIEWEHRFDDNSPLYTQISRDGIVLHLSEHYGDCIPGSKILIQMKGVDYLQKELYAKNYKYFKPGIKIEPWNAKTMSLIDPFGNRIIFSEDLENVG